MFIFNRVKAVISSELHALLNTIENPVKILDHKLHDMEKDLKDAQLAVARQMANFKMLGKRVKDAKHLILKYEQEAIKKLEVGNENLARNAIKDKQKQQRNYRRLYESYHIAKKDVEVLKRKLNELKKEYHSIQLKKDAIKYKAETARLAPFDKKLGKE